MDSHDPSAASLFLESSAPVSTGMAQPPAPDPVSPERRALLRGVLAASTAALIPAGFAVASGTDTANEAFLATSETLCGQASLDPDAAARLCNALIADDPQFAAGVQALASLIDQRKIDPLKLQQVLDDERSPLAALPRKIVTAWYVGVVGEGERARCLTFESNLANQIVSDKLLPPSYCYGDYGSWSEKP